MKFLSNKIKFWVREYRHPQIGIIIAACDEDLLGETLKKGTLDIYVSPNFYGGKLVDSDELVVILKKADSLNLIGEHVVKIAEDIGLIHSEAKIFFRGKDGRKIPHAQMIKMRF